MKNCPFCKELIQDDAIKCRFCGEYLAKLPLRYFSEDESCIGAECPKCGHRWKP